MTLLSKLVRANQNRVRNSLDDVLQASFASLAIGIEVKFLHLSPCNQFTLLETSHNHEPRDSFFVCTLHARDLEPDSFAFSALGSWLKFLMQENLESCRLLRLAEQLALTVRSFVREPNMLIVSVHSALQTLYTI